MNPFQGLQFFCIILDPSDQLQRLRIPTEFGQKHRRLLRGHVFLRAPEGEEHKVKVTKDKDAETWFTDGWEEFAAKYPLSLGTMLVFQYEGNSRFNVLIFDVSCSEIDYNNFPEGADNTQSAIARAKDFRSENDYPIFVAKMHSSYLSGTYRLWVEARHAKQWLLGLESDELLLKLAKPSRGDARTWKVNFIREPERPGRRTVVRITGTGWKGFAMDNGLEVHDACVFELVKRDPMTYRVHIFHD